MLDWGCVLFRRKRMEGHVKYKGGIMDIHLKSSGKQELVFSAGYVNRKNRRRLAKKDPALLDKLLKMSGQK